MKTFKLFGMVLLALTMSMSFASCSDDADEPVNEEGTMNGTLYGTWESTWEKGFEIWPDPYYKKEWDKSTSGLFITFNRDGTGTECDTGDKEMKLNFTWTLKGDKLIRHYDNQPVETEDVGIIRELSKNTLKIFTQNEENYNVTWESLVTYKKISR